MNELIDSKIVKARKDHDCDASDFLIAQGWSGMGFSRKQLRDISSAKKNNFKIKAGETYVKQCLKNGDDIYTFKAIPAIHDICIEHDLYYD